MRLPSSTRIDTASGSRRTLGFFPIYEEFEKLGDEVKNSGISGETVLISPEQKNVVLNRKKY
jgi:hypothetical protein